MLFSATDLRYFVAVAETLNVRCAAEQLNISQPSVSVAIRRLEDVLGVSLLVRFKKGVRLTRTGEQFATKARVLLEKWGRVCSEAAERETEVSGQYVIGSCLELGLTAVPESLADLLQSYF